MDLMMVELAEDEKIALSKAGEQSVNNSKTK